MNVSTARLGIGLVLAACGSNNEGPKTELPDMELSTLKVDFGEVNWGEPVTREVFLRNSGALPMGISQIIVAPDGDKGQDYEKNFTVVYDFAKEVVCDDGSGGDADAKDVEPNGTKKGPKDSGDTGYYDDTGDTGETVVVQQVLNPGCEIPIHITMDPTSLGDVQAGLLIATMDEPTDRDLSYYRDPDEEYKIIALDATAISEKGRIYVDPIRLDFGFVWAGEDGKRYARIENVGTGDLQITGWEFAKSCNDWFDVFPKSSALVLEPGDSTSLEISYSPDADDVTDEPSCAMKIFSDDPNISEAEVELRANQQGLSLDTPPVVQLISPAPGYVVNSGVLKIELDMWDANQPADTLDCYVRSALLKMAALADCIPTSKNGHVIAEIDASTSLDPGTDTIEVIVTDAFGQKAVASTTVVYLMSPPANDGDGDGFSSTASGGLDCDDADATVYPEAAELPDLKDNNCEDPAVCVPVACLGVAINPCIDEGTVLGDDDFDCFTEADGDCNDWPTFGATTYPDAAEVPDGIDNDCDGTIDENTSAYDDDGDGFDEFNGDFNDADPAINPGAIEYCDGIDNDCDDYIDDAGACIPIDSRPVILAGSAGVWNEKTDIAVNETTTIGVYAFDADGDTLTYVWTQDPQLPGVAMDNTSGPVVTFTAPSETLNNTEEHRYTTQVQVSDDEGNLVWAYGYVWVHSDPVDLTIGSSADSGGCKNGNQALAPLLPLALLVLARRRRSRAA